jgi:aldehyde:ferredoxin oxidoreductase
MGERIWNMERQFNNAAGFTRKDDDLPMRLKTEAAKVGPAKGLVSGIDKMIPEYYDLRGWDRKVVRPPKPSLVWGSDRVLSLTAPRPSGRGAFRQEQT